jgi:hypothetical protein
VLIYSQKVVSTSLRMNVIASSSSQSWSGANLQADTQCSVNLDGIFYELTDRGSIQCELRRLERDFPRNFIYFEGRVFQVQLFSVLNSAVDILDNLVLPRNLRGIYAEGEHPCSTGALIHIEFIAFEFQSELYEIGTKSISNSSSLRSICLPASVEFLGEHSFSHCRSLSSFTFESGSKLSRIEACAL